RAVIYLNDIKRPNMHTALHFAILAHEYALPVNCSVLQGEDKHKYFKKVIYNTNHHQVEKDLLTKENERQTIRFILSNAFQYSDPELTKLVQNMFVECPVLFNSILPRSEQMVVDGILDEDDGDDEAFVSEDANHKMPSVSGCIQAKYCRAHGMPTRGAHMENNFRRSLSRA